MGNFNENSWDKTLYLLPETIENMYESDDKPNKTIGRIAESNGAKSPNRIVAILIDEEQNRPII
ncbi:MAG: hypothetical protein U5K51_03535 [Flavobacteriaceae bacterium]|nr:hypothetical protein [Flavobacteriaceae bacterium]